MPVMHTWPEHEQAQMSLNLYELAKYYSYASGGIANAFCSRTANCLLCCTALAMLSMIAVVVVDLL